MKDLVIGAGGVGSAIANIASRRTFIASMVVADRDLTRTVDPEIIINAVDPGFVMPIFSAGEPEKKNYMDMAMTLITTEQ